MVCSLSVYLSTFGPVTFFGSPSRKSPHILLFGIADLTRPQLPKCKNHLVSFIKVDGLSVSYIVHIFDNIKSRTMVYRYIVVHIIFDTIKLRTMVYRYIVVHIIFDTIKLRTMV